MAEIEAALAAKNQQLAFEPGDWGPLYGEAAGQGTIGGVLACNLSGPRRLKAGAARDHFLGVQRRQRPRRDLQGRRQGGEERHRLRPAEAALRFLRHAGCHGRGDPEGAARAGEVAHGAARSGSTMRDAIAAMRRRSTAPMRWRAPPICRRESRRAPASISSQNQAQPSPRSASKAPRPRSTIAARRCVRATRRRHRDRRVAFHALQHVLARSPRRRALAARSRRPTLASLRAARRRRMAMRSRRSLAGAESARRDATDFLRLGRRSDLAVRAAALRRRRRQHPHRHRRATAAAMPR